MKLELELQRRNRKGRAVVTRASVDPRRTGIVSVDMWNYHWCNTMTERAGALVPRMNGVFACARRLGMQIFHCPTDVADSYVGTVPREAAIATPRRPLPERRDLHWPAPRDGDCMCGPGIVCLPDFGWTAMDPNLVVDDADLVSRGLEELYSLCKERRITNLIYVGIATNMCLFYRPEGMRSMAEHGFNVMVARDLTAGCTEYDPKRPYTPEDGTDEIVALIERSCAPSVNLADAFGKAGLWRSEGVTQPVRFAPAGWVHRPYQFEKPFVLTLTCPLLEDGAEIRYTTDGSRPTATSKRYAKPFTVRTTTLVRASAFKGGREVALERSGYYAKLPPKPPMPDVHLSDLTPVRTHWSFSDMERPRINKSFVRTPLKMRGVTYEKGLGLRPPAQMVYAVRPEYDRFVALAGIDETILQDGLGARFSGFPSGVFKVFIDGELVQESPVVRITQEPWRFDVEVPRGSRLLSFAVTDADGVNVLDHANVVNAGFVLKK